jgi:hypothetical protein
LVPSSPKPSSAGPHDHSTSADYRLEMGKVGHPGKFYGNGARSVQALGYSGNASPGTCPGDGTHDYSKSADYTSVAVSSNRNATFNAHETGHRYGLARSRSANPDVEYGNLEITRRLNSPKSSTASVGKRGPV